MHVKKFVVCLWFVLSAASWAETTTGAPSANDGPAGNPPPVTAELKAAFDACKSQGKPGDAAFDTCMTSKGFNKPEGAQKPPGK